MHLALYHSVPDFIAIQSIIPRRHLGLREGIKTIPFNSAFLLRSRKFCIIFTDGYDLVQASDSVSIGRPLGSISTMRLCIQNNDAAEAL
jgi:hypothetical protein